ncbi:hypothetical protein pEaSNUABM35_00279 [Erwinia phage pEa_SNUABM_35]|uniref:Uncharacterized protein n=1 Tax=Erwinia phage pEa_SNUABM_35 TaxID=2869557 RepID=A0AAE7XR98_9CAUD|nr:hypothetical protein MPK65_gp279 [Erwinia phage pEa_SNUABM_35]QZE60196.1 hypothetical protein pEaSNUABM35_00279 [Erwinia phage pEa_SNUABM_35]QZE60532.1 hypothetical protein pEaSNUABM36_00279 [Erwinia phage pEa_SNUABM_36]
MKPNKWKVKFTQIDKPTNTFTATYGSLAEFEKWAQLHSNNGFTVEVETSVVVEIPLVSWTYPASPDQSGVPRLFHVKHYSSDEQPSLIGMKRYFHVEGDREEVEEFADLLNKTIYAARTYVEQGVTYTVEGYAPSGAAWLTVQSGLATLQAVEECLAMVRSRAPSAVNVLTALRVARIVREVGEEITDMGKHVS